MRSTKIIQPSSQAGLLSSQLSPSVVAQARTQVFCFTASLRASARFDDNRLSWDVNRLFMMRSCMFGTANASAMPSTTMVIINSTIVKPADFFMSVSIGPAGRRFTVVSRER